MELSFKDVSQSCPFEPNRVGAFLCGGSLVVEHLHGAQRAAATSDTLIFTVTYNEALNIDRLLKALFVLRLDADLLVVDDLGTDGTEEVLKRHAEKNPRLDYVVRPQKLGIGSAYKVAWEYARRLGYSRAVSLDADLSHDPDDIPRLLAALDAGADIAIGSRFLKDSRLDYRGLRLFLSKGANLSLRLATQLPVTEYTTSFRAMRLAAIPNGLVESIFQDGYSFFFTFMVRCARQGLTIREIPIHFHQRLAGKSKISKREILRSACSLIRLAFERNAQTDWPTEPHPQPDAFIPAADAELLPTHKRTG
jgi:dolichol-phosphate mannosyltransferase